MQKTAMTAVMHSSMIKAVCDALVNIDDPMVPTAMVATNNIEKKSNRVKIKKEISGPR